MITILTALIRHPGGVLTFKYPFWLKYTRSWLQQDVKHIIDEIALSKPGSQSIHVQSERKVLKLYFWFGRAAYSRYVPTYLSR